MKKYVIATIITTIIVIFLSGLNLDAYYKKISLRIELYEQTHFKGKKIVIIDDIADLDDYCFGGKANSVMVFKGPNYVGTAKVSLYRDKNFRGGSLDLQADENISDLEKDKGFGNKIFSAKFPN